MILGRKAGALSGAMVIVLCAAFSGCEAPPPPSDNQVSLQARAHRFFAALTYPRLEFWPQHFSRRNAFGHLLAAPLRSDKTLLAFRAAYFEAAARGVDMRDTDRHMAALFARYDMEHRYRPLIDSLAQLAGELQTARAPEAPSNAFRYAAMGASESIGAGASPPSQAWVYLVALRLRASHPQLRLCNAASGGKTTQHALEAQLPKVLEFQPDLVTYAAGLNDLQYGVPVETARANTERVLKALREKTRARVVLTGLSMAARLPIFHANIPRLRERRQHLSPERIAAFDAAIRALAAQYGAVFVDIGQAVPDAMAPEQVDALFSYDGVHPNNQGHAAMAEIFWAGIEQALAQAPAPPQSP